jgi:isopropylmalate/citramalate/homocitrate synthase-like protein
MRELAMQNREAIRIFDTTLRDGEQTPGVSLTPENKLVIARQLDRLGVDAIEIGTPITSKGEIESARLAAKEGLTAEVYGLARLVKADVDAVIDGDLGHVHLFIATSDIHLKHKLRKTRKEILEMTLDILDYAKDHGLVIEFSAEDATRTDLAFLIDFFSAVAATDVYRINIPDTVGIMTPRKMRDFVAEINAQVTTPLSVHCHDDFGMAVANSLAGVEAGADQVHVAVNGLGERAGNASMEEVVVSLNLLHKKQTRINTELIYQTSQLVSRLTGIPVQPNKAIVGENAFTHESGIHTHGLVRSSLTYEPIPPELVGRRSRIVAGKHAGAHGIRAELGELNIAPSNGQLKEITTRIKAMGDRGKQVTDADLIQITEDVMDVQITAPKKIIELKELAVMTGTNMTPTASVRIALDGRDYSAAENGVGPVDAAMKAIQKVAMDRIDVWLSEYRLEALTGGSNAVAEVVVKVEDKAGNLVSARSANEDIVKASVDAMIAGINRLLLRQAMSKQQ